MKRATIVLTALVILGGACYISAVVGYVLGGPQYAARFTPADAAYTVAVLQTLRTGDVESATSMLEAQLDSQIVEHSTFDPRVASWFDFAAPERTVSSKLMGRVASYRDAHPSSASAEIQSTIDAHLSRFRR